MASKLLFSDPLPALGLIAPSFIALGITEGALNLCFNSRPMTWLGLEFIFFGLYFSGYTRRLLERAGQRSPSMPWSAMKYRIDLNDATAQANKLREVQFRDFE